MFIGGRKSNPKNSDIKSGVAAERITPEQLRAIFDACDQDGNGIVTKQEFEDLLSKTGNYQKEDIKNLIDGFDRDEFTFEQFQQYFMDPSLIGDQESIIDTGSSPESSPTKKDASEIRDEYMKRSQRRQSVQYILESREFQVPPRQSSYTEIALNMESQKKVLASEYEVQLDSLQNENQKLRSELQSLQLKVKKIEPKNTELQKELEEVKQDLQKSYDESKLKKQTYAKDRKSKGEDIKRLESRNKELEEQNDKITAENSRLLNQLEPLQQKAKDYDNQLQELTAQLQEQKTQYEELKASYDRLRTNVRKENFRKPTKLLESSKYEVISFKDTEQSSEVSEEKEEHRSSSGSLQDELQGLSMEQKDFDGVKVDVKESQKKQDTLNEQEEEVGVLKKQFEELNENYQKTINELKQKTESCVSYERKLKEYQKQTKELEEVAITKRSLEEEVGTLKKQLQELNENYQKTINELKQKTESCVSYERKLKEYQKQTKEEEVGNLKKQLQELNENYQKTINELKQKTESCVSYEREIKEYQKQISKLEKQTKEEIGTLRKQKRVSFNGTELEDKGTEEEVETLKKQLEELNENYQKKNKLSSSMLLLALILHRKSWYSKRKGSTILMAVMALSFSIMFAIIPSFSQQEWFLRPT